MVALEGQLAETSLITKRKKSARGAGPAFVPAKWTPIDTSTFDIICARLPIDPRSFDRVGMGSRMALFGPYGDNRGHEEDHCWRKQRDENV